MAGKIKYLLLFVLLTFLPAFADENVSLVTPQHVSFDICTKDYAIGAERLFYLAISAVKANKFEIEEIQSKTGYILFTAAGKQYLASIVKVDNSHTQLKITPTNNNYYFAPGIVLNFFKYIDLNINSALTPLPKA